MVCGQAGFFSAPPLALRARLAFALLLPLFTQKITPVLQAINLAVTCLRRLLDDMPRQNFCFWLFFFAFLLNSCFLDHSTAKASDHWYIGDTCVVIQLTLRLSYVLW